MFYINVPYFDYYWVRVVYYWTAPDAKQETRRSSRDWGSSEERAKGDGRLRPGSRLSSSNRLLVWISLCSPVTYSMFCGFHGGFIVELPRISRGFGYFICVCWFAVWFFYFNLRFGLWYRRGVTPRARRVSLFSKAWRKSNSFRWFRPFTWSQSILKHFISLLFSRCLLGFVWTPFDL